MGTRNIGGCKDVAGQLGDSGSSSRQHPNAGGRSSAMRSQIASACHVVSFDLEVMSGNQGSARVVDAAPQSLPLPLHPRTVYPRASPAGAASPSAVAAASPSRTSGGTDAAATCSSVSMIVLGCVAPAASANGKHATYHIPHITRHIPHVTRHSQLASYWTSLVTVVYSVKSALQFAQVPPSICTLSRIQTLNL